MDRNEYPGPRPRYGSVGQFTSEEEYLNALRTWVSAKEYYRPGELSADGHGVIEGFYGKTTIDEYCNRPKLHIMGDRKKRKEEKERQRLATVDASADRGANSDAQQEADKHRRKSSIGNLLRRQRTR